MTYQKQAPDVWATPEANQKISNYKGSVFFSKEDAELADIYAQQFLWDDPTELLLKLVERSKRRLSSYLSKPYARPDFAKELSDEYEMTKKCYLSVFNLDLPTWKLASDAIKQGMKQVPTASMAVVYVPLKLEQTDQSILVDLWNRPVKIL